MVLSPLYNLSFAIPILTIGRSATLGSWVPWDFDSKHSSGAILSLIHIRYNMVGTIVGLPRWSTGKESARQFRRCRRDGQSLGQEDSLEEEMATHSSILAWRIPWTEEPDGLQSMGLRTVRHNITTEHTHRHNSKGQGTHTHTEVAQSCPTLCDPMDCSPPGSLVHGIFQAWILEWVAVSFSKGRVRSQESSKEISLHIWCRGGGGVSDDIQKEQTPDLSLLIELFEFTRGIRRGGMGIRRGIWNSLWNEWREETVWHFQGTVSVANRSQWSKWGLDQKVLLPC